MGVKIHIKEKIFDIEAKNINILQALAEHSIFINAYCGGKGICGKCKIKYLHTPPKPNAIEQRFISEEELKAGFRLACMHTFKENDSIEVAETFPAFMKTTYNTCTDENKEYIAVDIGTTTISVSLVDNGKKVSTINLLNPQVSFGGDVFSRIAYSNKHSHTILSKILNNAIKQAVEKLLTMHNKEKVHKMVVAANPTMLAFFLEYNPHSIGTYPYNPPFVGSKSVQWNGINVYIPPVISAFIGSDITAGLINLDFEEDFLFIDIGTNCEFILKYKDKIYAASVPGGPALEGVGIDYGIMAQGGAIEKVEYKDTIKCLTIGNEKAEGIAGSGLISAIALLNKYGIIDKSGRIQEPWELEDTPFPLINRIKREGFLLENNIYITQKSIREFQLVKGALNAGISILMHKTRCDLKEINRVYIAGGFTKSLTKDEIVDSNLLNIDKKFTFLGNSSLRGALKLFCKENVKKIEEMAKKIKYVEIANEETFQELYIKYMDFL